MAGARLVTTPARPSGVVFGAHYSERCEIAAASGEQSTVAEINQALAPRGGDRAQRLAAQQANTSASSCAESGVLAARGRFRVDGLGGEIEPRQEAHGCHFA